MNKLGQRLVLVSLKDPDFIRLTEIISESSTHIASNYSERLFKVCRENWEKGEKVNSIIRLLLIEIRYFSDRKTYQDLKILLEKIEGGDEVDQLLATPEGTASVISRTTKQIRDKIPTIRIGDESSLDEMDSTEDRVTLIQDPREIK